MDIKPINKINVTWVTRSFLDYRIPVFQCLDNLIEGRLNILFSGDYVPSNVAEKAMAVLAGRAIGLRGEWKIGKEDRQYMANRNISIRFQPGILKAIYRTKPDVLVCDGFFKWTLPALVYRFLFSTPLVINYERTFHTERNAQWYRTLYRKFVVKFTDAIDCNGMLSAEYTKTLGMPAARITTGHMSADTKSLYDKVNTLHNEQREQILQKLDLHGVVFLYVGRIALFKGCLELLDAWKEFSDELQKEATLLIVGEGEQEKEMIKRCREWQITNVRFAGRVEYDEIAEYYAVADLFVIPTLEDNWSLVVPEAMACGLPVLCSKYNGCWPELVHNDVNGWIFDPMEKEEIIRVLTKAFANKSKLKGMGIKSLEIVGKHGPDNAAKSILEACRIAIRHYHRPR